MEQIIDIGNTVVCDVCNSDFTNSEEQGGFLFGSYAYCPKCAVSGMQSIMQHNEQQYVTDVCPTGMSYRDWVLKLRAGNNTIRVYTK